MKRFKFHQKITAIVVALFFIFQSMPEINKHTYTIGVDSYHYTCGCFGCWQTHLAVKCNSNSSICSY
jgi:hypothetical protein